jgi:hypothetical protein
MAGVRGLLAGSIGERSLREAAARCQQQPARAQRSIVAPYRDRLASIADIAGKGQPGGTGSM